MNYNFSSSPRVGSCIPTRTACTTDPRYHHNFDPHCHNHFNPHCHDHFDPCYDRLELNIQLPDIKIPPCPDVKCPDVEIPPCPECPACPEPKKPIDFSKLTIAVDATSGEIKDAITKKTSGLKFADCKEIIDKTDNNLEIDPDNRLKGGCDSNSECKACVDAINASIIDSRKEPAFFSEKMSVPEDTVHII
ncbi:hypothetical protein [Wolbachia endosymbiont (group A) of Sympetrum striolatum]|uniref:hypothetical protein n=1 Tax=Wolbachia endosymbiont (group A) of Sympetrum striolatum TaxID=2954061 RepID=UPI00222656B3|nr:hypothetical protein [Wolbachia endosymbiont (group A) of Sympetrum striolatum]